MSPGKTEMTRVQKIMSHYSFCNLDLPSQVVWHSDIFFRYSIAFLISVAFFSVLHCNHGNSVNHGNSEVVVVE